LGNIVPDSNVSCYLQQIFRCLSNVLFLFRNKEGCAETQERSQTLTHKNNCSAH